MTATTSASKRRYARVPATPATLHLALLLAQLVAGGRLARGVHKETLHMSLKINTSGHDVELERALCRVQREQNQDRQANRTTPLVLDTSGHEAVKTTSCGRCHADGPTKCCGVCMWSQCANVPDNHPMDLVEAAASMDIDLYEVTPCKLFHLIRGRTVWFIGDSQTRNIYNAVECFLSSLAPLLERTWPLPSKNLTISTLYVDEVREKLVYPYCLPLMDATRVCMLRIDHGQAIVDQLLPALLKHSPGFRNDVVVMNFGLHYPTPIWEEAYSAAGELYGQHLKATAEYLQEHDRELPLTIWMTTPPQHFNTSTGAFIPKNPDVVTCVPGDMHSDGQGYYNELATPIMHAAGLPILDVYTPSRAMWRYHYNTYSTGDCSHFCTPGPYQLWIHQLYRLLHALGTDEY